MTTYAVTITAVAILAVLAWCVMEANYIREKDRADDLDARLRGLHASLEDTHGPAAMWGPLPETTRQRMDRIRGQIAANEARRVDDEWAAMNGGAS